MRNTYLQMCDYGSRFRILKGGKISLVVSAFFAGVTLLHAAPSGGVVTSGTANIAQNGAVTTINQSSQKASINWTNFSIGASETVNFNQPNVSAIALNRVVGNEKSIIDGALNANGQVWILNSNGVLFNSTAKINTSGLLATTKSLSDEDFQKGNYLFKGDSTASVINLGTIEIANGGYASLLANSVQNEGTIKAIRGVVTLTGANEATINLNGNSLVSLKVNKGVLDALVENKGAILADGGKVYLTTNAVDELLKSVVNNTGIIEAKSIDDLSSEVILYAHGGTTNVSGSIDARGGFVETSGKELSVANGTVIKAQKWLLDPTDVVIESTGGTNLTGSSVSASAIESAFSTVTDIEIQATHDITVNQTIDVNYNTPSANTLTLTAGNDLNINAEIKVGRESALYLNHGWNGDVNSPTYGTNGKITFGMTTDKTNFTGKITLENATQYVNEQTFYINDVEQNIIRDATQLQAMKDNRTGNFVLAGDIDLNSVIWTPIGSYGAQNSYTDEFTGTFNGLGHTISNLTLNGDFKYTDNNGGQAAGLFGNIASRANIAGVRLLNASVTNTANYIDDGSNSTAQTAALVGTARAQYDQNNNYAFVASPTIHNNIVTGSTISSTGTGGYVGGIVGTAREVTLSDNAVTNTTVSSANSYDVGGIVGYASKSTITDSYVADSTIKSAYGEVGGIAGYIDETIIDNATVKNSSIYTTGTIQGSYGAGGIVGDAEYMSEIKNSSVENSTIAAMQDVGGIVGYMSGGEDPVKITNSFYDLGTIKIGDKTGNNVGDNVAGVITYGGIDTAQYSAWLSGNKTALSASSLLGSAVNGYYVINNKSDFRKMLALAYDPANKFKLASSFTLDNGLYLPVLRGELDGNGETISGLNVQQSYNSYIGLVGRLEGGTVKNLTLASPTLDGYAYVGSVAGYAITNANGTFTPTISNVTVNNFTYSHTKEFDVASQHTDTGVYNIGAIAGGIENGTLTNLSASGNITINLTANNDGFNGDSVYAEYIGGLLGGMYYSTLDTATSSVAITVNVFAKAHTNDSTWNTNDVGAYEIGGLIGTGNRNTIANVSASGTIDVTAKYEITEADDHEGNARVGTIGGLFGEMDQSFIKSVTATNTIVLKGNDEIENIGGITGAANSSFYDTVTRSGNITITFDNGANYLYAIGGALGYTENSILKDIDVMGDITFTGSISGDVGTIGGLVGGANYTNILSSSYTGTIDGEALTEGSNVGGLVGYNYGETSNHEYAYFDKTISADVDGPGASEKATLLSAYNNRADVVALKALGYTVEDNSYGTQVSFSVVTPDNTEWGVIKDSIATINIKAPHMSNVGGLVGDMEAEDGGQIINSSVAALNGTGKVVGDSYVGGLVGYNYYGNISDSHAAIEVSANVNGDGYVGGLVGYNEGGSSSEYAYPDTFNSTSYDTYQAALDAVDTVKDAFIAEQLAANPGYEVYYVNANAYTDNNGVANSIQIQLELIKYTPNSVISNSYATGKVTGGSNVGGLVGYNYGEDGGATIKNSYASGNVSGTNNVGGLVGTAENIVIDTVYSTGTVSGNDMIGGLVGFATETQIKDSYHTTGKVTGSNSTDGYVGGLVGQLDSGSSISGSYATSEVEGVAGVGGLVGDALESDIENSYATGKVISSGMQMEGEGIASAVGGLVGSVMGSTITKSYATGQVVANGQYAGGLVGAGLVLTVQQSYATGEVVSQSDNVGGLVGGSISSTIEESYSTGKVTGSNYVGGLVGGDIGRTTILNTYSSGDVTASGNNIGGLIGALGTESTITNSYTSSKITRTGTNQTSIGGLAGSIVDEGAVTNSFYDKTKNAGMNDETSYGKSTIQLKTLATYTTDLGEGTWDMNGANGYYPTLDFSSERTSIWTMAEGSLPVEPTPNPTPNPNPTIPPRIIDAIISGVAVQPPVIPSFTPPPLPSIPQQLNLGGQVVQLMSTPLGESPTQIISLGEIRQMQQESTGGAEGVKSPDIRIPLGQNSLIQLVNGGLRLPEGIEQEFFMAQR